MRRRRLRSACRYRRSLSPLPRAQPWAVGQMDETTSVWSTASFRSLVPDGRLEAFSVRERNRLRDLIRYGATSLLALSISECTLLCLVAVGTNPTIAALATNAAGIVPSYLLSRYWIWSESSSTRLPRQIALYVLTSIVAIATTTAATGGIASVSRVLARCTSSSLVRASFSSHSPSGWRNSSCTSASSLPGKGYPLSHRASD